MTLPAYPSAITSSEIWNNFQVATVQISGQVSGTGPNWSLGGLGSGVNTNAYTGYAIRAPEPEGHRVGTLGTYTFNEGFYGPSTWGTTFTMAGAKPPSGPVYTISGGLETSKYDIFPQRSSASIATADYRAGAGLVPAGTYGYPGGVKTNIPSSGSISHGNFHGAFRINTFYVSVLGMAWWTDIVVPKGTWKLFFRAIGGGGGGGGNDGNLGSYGGVGMSMQVAMTVTSNTDQTFRIYTGGGGGAGFTGTAPVVTNGGSSYLTDRMGGIYNGIARGGHGGSSGNNGTSGYGGGGGGVSAIGWIQDSTSSSSEILLALAGGGGGGTGAGLGSITQSPGAISNSNIRNRGLTTSLTTLNTFNAQADIFSPYPPGTSAYRLAGSNSDGQGWNTMRNYYPPGPVDAYDSYDGGGGGGGGGGNGYGGGLTRNVNSTRRWELDDNGGGTSTWTPPNEFCGEGGGQGFAYFNLSYVNTYSYGFLGEYGSGYGTGGVQETNGAAGAAWLKVTNDLSDTTFY